MKTSGGSALISAVLGLGLATVFRRACAGGGCFVVSGPSIEHVTGSVWELDDKCYRYSAVPAMCDGSERRATKSNA